MAQEAYVSFETAKLLKEKGFDWRTQYVYTEDGTGFTPPRMGKWKAKSNIPMATHQMACAWLREEKKIHIRIIEDAFGENYHFEIYSKNPNTKMNYYVPNYYESTYEDAVEEACSWALKNLI